MNKETIGKVVAVKKQQWIKINTKPVRVTPMDGSIHPHIITVSYTVDGQTYTKKKWLWPRTDIPRVGHSVSVIYEENRPQRALISFT